MHTKILPIVAAGAFLFAGCSSSTSSSDTTVDGAAGADTTIGASVSTDSTVPADATPDSTTPSVADSVVTGDTAVTPAPSAVATTVAPTEAVTDVSVQPGLSKDKFVGAASDVKTETCGADAGGWSASGTVTNASGAAATYRVYVAFNVKGTTDTRGLVQTDVKVADAKTEKWKASAKVAGKDLICILRVERTAAV